MTMTLLKTVGAGLLLGLALLAVTMPADAGDCVVRNRGSCYSSYSYYTPTYYPSYTPSYNYYPYKEYVVKTVEVPVAPSYYYDSSSAYRDNLLADAIAYRVLAFRNSGVGLGATGQAVPIQQEGQAKGADGVVSPQRQPAAAPVQTQVDPRLTKIVNDKDNGCVKCHNASVHKGNVDLSDLATTPVAVRWAAHGMVSAGAMPQDEAGKPKPLPDADVEPFFTWARSASRVAGK